MPGRRSEVSRGAEAVAYAADPKSHLSATPSTLIGDVDGVADRQRNLSPSARLRLEGRMAVIVTRIGPVRVVPPRSDRMLGATALPRSGFANSANLTGNLVIDLVRGDAVWRPTGTR